MKRLLKVLLVVLGVLVLVGFVAFLVFDKPIPKGVENIEAEQLTDKVYARLNKAAWDTTKVISWDFAGVHEFVWNKRTDSVMVSWGDFVVNLHTPTQRGSVFESGKKLTGSVAEEKLADAWAYFCNDSFWLIAPFKLRDPGTSRSIVEVPGDEQGLLITYTSGGVTPGDSYLWFIDPTGLPTRWQMWTSNIPVGGLEASWSDWQTLPSGAEISTRHDLSIMELVLTLK